MSLLRRRGGARVAVLPVHERRRPPRPHRRAQQDAQPAGAERVVEVRLQNPARALPQERVPRLEGARDEGDGDQRGGDEGALQKPPRGHQPDADRRHLVHQHHAEEAEAQRHLRRERAQAQARQRGQLEALDAAVQAEARHDQVPEQPREEITKK